MQAMHEAGIKGANIKQIVNWSEEETYNFTKELIENQPNLSALWLQTSNAYKGALRAINDSAKRDQILLVTFDAEPEFLTLIPKGKLLGSAMQQPYLMGEEALNAMDKYLSTNIFTKSIQLPILSISAENIEQMLPIIKRNVLGQQVIKN